MATQSETISSPVRLNVPKKRHRTLWGDVWLQFRKHKPAMFGFVVLVILVFGVIVGPMLYTVDPEYIDILVSERDPGLFNLLPPKNLMKGQLFDAETGSLSPSLEFFYVTPDLSYPFGTDDIGRDTFARNLAGGRISLSVGVVAMLLSITIGTFVGGLAGYFPRLDGPLMRFVDMMLALPGLPLLLVIILLFRDTLRSLLGPETGIFILVVFVIGILAWMPTARVVRGQVLSIKEKEFVEAARSIGSREHLILSRHVLPNVLSPIIVSATLGVAAAILTESALSFLGLGFPSDVPTWGRLVVDGRDFIERIPWLVIWPGVFISLTVLSINFMGDGLRDALDPKLRK